MASDASEMDFMRRLAASSRVDGEVIGGRRGLEKAASQASRCEGETTQPFRGRVGRRVCDSGRCRRRPAWSGLAVYVKEMEQ